MKIVDASREPTDSRPVHEQTYQALRERILFGGFLPGRPVTLRGLAQSLGVSPMPVREAVRRLIAERALTLHNNRRVSIPEMTRARYEQIVLARTLLEPELALQALPFITAEDIRTLTDMDDRIDAALATGDIEAYMRYNYAFHFHIYHHAPGEVLGGLVESLWLQFGPFMRLICGRYGTRQLVDQHKQAIAALEKADGPALRQALEGDIRQGIHYFGAMTGRE